MTATTRLDTLDFVASGETFDLTLTVAGTTGYGQIMSIAGTADGSPATLDGTYEGPDNLVLSGSPYVDHNGISFDANNITYNLYLTNAAADLISTGSIQNVAAQDLSLTVDSIDTLDFVASGETFDLTLTVAGTTGYGQIMSIAGTADGSPATLDGTYEGPDNLVLSGSPYVDHNGISFDANNVTYNLYLQNAAAELISTGSIQNVAVQDLALVVHCFCSGTRILTPAGEVAVEDLRVGDLVITAREGHTATSMITWTGRRALDVERHADPATVRPVRVCAGAFGAGIPARDVLLSPHHAIYVDGALFEAISLVNGVTILQDQTMRYVTYHHFELAQHDIVLAEGLPAESLLNTGGREMFETETGAMRLHPDWRTPPAATTCVPLHREGARLAQVKARLARLAETFGRRPAARLQGRVG